MKSVKLQILSVAVILLLLLANASCLQSAPKNEPAPVSVSQEKLVPTPATSLSNEKTSQTSTPKSKKKSNVPLICSPAKSRLGDILTLTMDTPHGGYLEIITPKKEYVFLSELDADEFVTENQKAGTNPFFAASAFAKLDELKINTAEATTIDVEKDKANGKYQLKKLFAKPGKYKVLLSLDSFEQDDPTIEGRCEIELIK